jgi:hypothetical protein
MCVGGGGLCSFLLRCVFKCFCEFHGIRFLYDKCRHDTRTSEGLTAAKNTQFEVILFIFTKFTGISCLSAGFIIETTNRVSIAFDAGNVHYVICGKNMI